MSDWPRCLTEIETLERMLAGWSISRLGDGEFAIALGGGNATHKPNNRLAKELREILKAPADGCLPAIPTMDPAGPRYDRWARHKPRYRKLVDMERIYGSAFVGQRKSAPWVGTTEHADGFRRLWRGRKVVAVSRGGLPKLFDGAASVDWIECPEHEAYSVIDDLEKACLDAGADIAVLAAGPCATVLANRLSGKGLHAIDLGRGARTVMEHR